MATRVPALIQLSDPRVAAQLVVVLLIHHHCESDKDASTRVESWMWQTAEHQLEREDQQEKENSPAVCIGLTPGGARGLPWFREEFCQFF